MQVVECVQGTPEWLYARAGKVTASRVADVMARIKNGEAAARRNYKAQVVAEILTGQPQDNTFVTNDMKNGIEQEPFACAAYELFRDVMVEHAGFVPHPIVSRFGASPDGLVNADGMIEIKCPRVVTHLQYLLDGVAPVEYLPQMYSGMDCCEREWCDFVSYCPVMPHHLQLFVVRVPRNQAEIIAIENEVARFNTEVDTILEQLKGR